MVATTSDKALKNTDFIFTVQTLFKNTPPSFKEPVQLQVLKVGQAASWQLPVASDSEGDEFEVNALITKKTPWLSFDKESLAFSFDGESTKESDTGQFKIAVILTDKYGASLTVSQLLFVVYEPVISIEESKDEEQTKPDE